MGIQGRRLVGRQKVHLGPPAGPRGGGSRGHSRLRKWGQKKWLLCLLLRPEHRCRLQHGDGEGTDGRQLPEGRHELGSVPFPKRVGSGRLWATPYLRIRLANLLRCWGHVVSTMDLACYDHVARVGFEELQKK